MSLYEPRGELDLLAVQRDDEDLEVLARRWHAVLARRPKGRTLPDGSPDLLVLLAAFTAEVDEGLDRLLTAPLAVPAPRAVPDAERGVAPLRTLRRRRTVRAVTAGVLAAGLVSVSGVAAAVTGDPFSPYKGLYEAVYGTDDMADGSPFGGASDGTELDRAVRAVETALAAGRLDRASVALERLRAGVGNREYGHQRAAAAQLAALEARLARAVAKDDRTGHGRATAPGQQVGAPAEPAGSGGEPGAEPGTSAGRPDGAGAGPNNGRGPRDKPGQAEDKDTGKTNKDTRGGGNGNGPDGSGSGAAAVDRPAKKSTKAGRTARDAGEPAGRSAERGAASDRG